MRALSLKRNFRRISACLIARCRHPRHFPDAQWHIWGHGVFLLDRNPEKFLLDEVTGFAPAARPQTRQLARRGMTATPQKRKKDQLALAQDGDKLFLRTGPIPTTPGGLGAEESGAERNRAQRSGFSCRNSEGAVAGRKIGPYYDFPNDLVTLHFFCRAGIMDGPSRANLGRAAATALFAAVRRWRDHTGAA